MIGELASNQHGVVSLGQLLRLGLSRAAIEARLKRKRLVALHRGVYAVGHTALTSDGRLIAAVWACGEDALLSHRSAGRKHGLLEWEAVRIEVTVPRRRVARPGMTLHRTRLIHPDDRTEIDGIPVTGVARTIVDLADVLNERQLEGTVRRAEILKVFDLKRIEATQERLPGRRGKHRLKRVLTAYQPEPHFLRSRAERRVKRLCKEHRLPQPQFNVQLHGYEVDVYWPEAALVLEFDGAETHHTRSAFHEDRRRDRVLAAEGIQTVRVTWPDLGAPLAAQVKRILSRR